MMNREMANKIAVEVITKKAKEKEERAKEYVTNEVVKLIENTAKKGEFKCTIFIPSHIDRTVAVDFLKANGFDVRGEYAYAEFEISWE